MSKNIIEIALKAGFINTHNGLESPFIEGEDLTDNLKLFASLLLAQPEHIADVGNMVVQDPVAWKVIDGTNGNYMFSRIKPTERSYKYDVVIPLYTAPPKREPLSDKEITKNTPKLIHIGERLAFHAGVRFAEKHHGIGGEE